MKRILWGLLAALLIAATLAGCARSVEVAETPELLEPVGVKVDTAVVTRGDLYAMSMYEGSVIAAAEELSFEIDGKIGEVCVWPGKWVEQGDLLFSLDQTALGERIASLVDTESDRLEEGLDWRARKEDSLKRLKQASRDEKIVALGDKLSNMRAIARDYTSKGEVFWDLFRIKDKSVHAWRYHALLDAFSELSDTYAYQEFDFLVNRIFPKE